MTGKMQFEKWGGPQEATLEDDLSWSSLEEMVALHLNANYRPDRSPAMGDAGLALLHKTAAALSGKVVEAREPMPFEEGRVY